MHHIRIVQLDSEQEEILKLATETAQGFLRARVRRADPEGLLSQSFELQALKFDNLMHALEQPPLKRWTDMEEHEQQQIAGLAELLFRRKTVIEAAAVYDTLLAAILSPAQKPYGKNQAPVSPAGAPRRPRVAKDEKGDPR